MVSGRVIFMVRRWGSHGQWKGGIHGQEMGGSHGLRKRGIVLVMDK
jgi:hypothetical protein